MLHFLKKDQRSTPLEGGLPRSCCSPISVSDAFTGEKSSKLLLEESRRDLKKKKEKTITAHGFHLQSRGRREHPLLCLRRPSAHLPLPPATRPPPLPQSQPGSCTAAGTLSPSPFWGLCRLGPAWCSSPPPHHHPPPPSPPSLPLAPGPAGVRVCDSLRCHVTLQACASVKGRKSSSPTSSETPSILTCSSPASLCLSLSLPPALSLSSEGPLPPLQLCRCVFVCTVREGEQGRNGPLPH